MALPFRANKAGPQTQLEDVGPPSPPPLQTTATTHLKNATGWSPSSRSIAWLRRHIQGRVLTPDDSPGFLEAIRVWNAAYQQIPALFVEAATERDVVVTVRFAREAKMPLAVLGGGHSYVGASSVAHGVQLSTRKLDSLVLSANGTAVSVGAGARMGPMYEKLVPQGLLFVGGSSAEVGVASYYTGGGVSYLTTRAHGYAVDNLLSARIVLASGQVVEASERSHPDLFWALRGGTAAQFGVLTELTIRLHAVGPQGVAFKACFPAASLPALMERLLGDSGNGRLLDAIPRTGSGLITLGDGDQVCVSLYSFSSRESEAAKEAAEHLEKKVLPELEKAAGTRAASTNITVVPLLSMVLGVDVDFDGYWACAIASKWMRASAAPRAFGDALLASYRNLSSEFGAAAGVEIEILGGKGAEQATPTQTAFPHRGKDKEIIADLFVVTPPADMPDRRATQERTSAIFDSHLGPYANGVYVNYASDGTTPREMFGPNLARLRSIKRKYDPTAFFMRGPGFTKPVDA